MRYLILSLLLSVSPGLYAVKQVYTFAIVPQQSASKMAKLWTPVLIYINQQTGLDVQFKTAKDIPTFEQRLSEGEYDFAYMNPYHFTVFNQTPGYQAVAKARDKKIKGILVVRKDSPIQSIQELNNMTLAFPAPAAFAASILPRAELSGMGNTYQARYVSSHDSVYRTVAKGLYPAGGGVMRTFNNVSPDIRDQLKVLWTTKGFTPHAIASHPNIPTEVSILLQSALVAMEQSEEGQQLLKNIKIKGFETAKNEDWDDVRALRIDLLTDLVRK
jgi:phosphonate transport system substrate-binding protein